MTFVGGYTVFLPTFWNIPDFLFSYTMIAVFPILFVAWKIVHKTKWVKPHEADLKKDLDEIEEYQRNYVPTPPKYVYSPTFNLFSLRLTLFLGTLWTSTSTRSSHEGVSIRVGRVKGVYRRHGIDYWVG
jgi:hypothetical protein